MKEQNVNELPPEQQYEIEAAFGKDTDTIIQLEKEDLEKPPEKKYPLEDILEVGDWVVIGHPKSGLNCTVGPVTEVKSYGFEIDPQNRTTSGFFGYDDFGGELGVCNEILDINGRGFDDEDGDLYEPNIVE